MSHSKKVQNKNKHPTCCGMRATMSIIDDAALLAARKTKTIYIHGVPTIVYEDEIKEELRKSLFSHSMLDFGA